MAGSVSGSSCCFNDSGLLFAQWSEVGKLKIWDTPTGIIKQEYTKNLHLRSPCTCLYWLPTSKRVSPRKKKLKTGQNVDDMEMIVMGTMNGNILVYDLATNDVKHVLEGHTSKVNSLSLNNNSLFSCSDDKYIIEWDLENYEIKSKWKTGNDCPKCILAMSNGQQLLSACYCIKLWDLKQKQILRTFIGHATEVISLVEMPGLEEYFLSSAQGDRVISAWSLASKEKTTAVASFMLKDGPLSVHVQNIGPDSPCLLSAVTESGIVQIFKHKLNGNISRPLKPIKNISVASENSNAKLSHPLTIYGILPKNNGNFIFAYGSPVFLLFETVSINDMKDENIVLVREDKRKTVTSEFSNKVKNTEVNENAEYISAAGGVKRRRKKYDVDVPLEDRIENLALASTASTDGPKKDNMAQLLIQGLQSQDKNLLDSVLLKSDDAVINSTVKNLPTQALVPLIHELNEMLTKRTMPAKCAVCWLMSVVRLHSGVLLSNPEIETIFEPLLTSVERRLSLLPSLLRLRGRLSLITDQISTNSSDDMECANEPLISYQEQESSDDGEKDLPSEGSDSDENWEEYSEMEEQDEEMNEK